MKRTICIAQIGFNSNIKQHISYIKDIIHANRSADLIVFPELILHGHPSVEKPEGFLYRRVKSFYRTIADDSDDLYSFIKETDARVILGELKGGPERFYNVATYIDKNDVKHYRKTHIHWSENFLAGNTLKVFKTPIARIGMTICFDAAFTEVWRVLTLKGAQIIVNISATPKSFATKYIRNRLTGAAISNQVFVVYANRSGELFSGHSAVIDPRGNILHDAGSNEKIVNFDLELDEIARWREEEQILSLRRPLLYRSIGKEYRMSNK